MNETCVNGNGSAKLTNSEKKTQNDILSLNSSGPIKPPSLKSQVLATPVGSVAYPDPHYFGTPDQDPDQIQRHLIQYGRQQL